MREAPLLTTLAVSATTASCTAPSGSCQPLADKALELKIAVHSLLKE